MVEPRTPWDDLKALTAEAGMEMSFEIRPVEQPPLVCEPMPHDFDWPGAVRWPMPEDMDEPTVCRVHHDEWWPCTAFREGRGVQHRPPVETSVLVVRPTDG